MTIHYTFVTPIVAISPMEEAEWISGSSQLGETINRSIDVAMTLAARDANVDEDQLELINVTVTPLPVGKYTMAFMITVIANVLPETTILREKGRFTYDER